MDESWTKIKECRKEQRAQLIALRDAISLERRRELNDAITAHIEAGFALLAGMTIAFCWPFKGEFDARFAIRRFRERGATAALPVVIGKALPLQFRAWWPGAPLKAGVYDIPFPDGTPLVVPDAAIVPMNGFDAQGYRLGYGGGYFDRTLASITPAPLAIGVAFETSRLPTIYPQPHDIPMDFVVTEAGIHARIASALQPVTSRECCVRVQELCLQRGLPRRPADTSTAYSSPPCYAGEFPGYFGEEPGQKT